MTKPRKKPQDQQRKEFKPLNDEQKIYVETIKNNVITVCYGRAGTGKSCAAISSAISGLTSGQFEYILVTKPIVTVGDDLGFFPGNLWQKIEPFFQNIIDEFIKQLGKADYYALLRERKIRYMPIELMRGITLDECFVILDEGQNVTLMQMKTLLTRIGKDAKLVINGDLKQSDLTKTSGLTIIVDKLQGINGLSFHHLNEIVRHSIITEILERLE